MDNYDNEKGTNNYEFLESGGRQHNTDLARWFWSRSMRIINFKSKKHCEQSQALSISPTKAVVRNLKCLQI